MDAIKRLRNLAHLSQVIRPIAVAKIFGVRVEIDWTWLFIFVLHCWAIASFRLPLAAPGYLGSEYWLTGFLVTAALLASVLAHELAHSVVAKAEGIGVSGITLHIFGGMSHLERDAPTPMIDFKIGIVGPASSFVLGLAFYLIGIAVGRGAQSLLLYDAFTYIGLVNMALAVFNLAPGFPLDGGRVLRAWLWHRKRDYNAATLAACRSGRNIALLIMVTGVVSGVRSSQYMVMLAALFVGLYLFDLANKSARRVPPPSSVRRVADVMTPATDVAPDLLISDLPDKPVKKGRLAPTRFPVTVGGRLHGILTREQLDALPAEKRAQLRARDVMRPVDATLFIDWRTPLAEARTRLRRNDLSFLAVLDNDGFVVGTVSAENFKD